MTRLIRRIPISFVGFRLILAAVVAGALAGAALLTLAPNQPFLGGLWATRPVPTGAGKAATRSASIIPSGRFLTLNPGDLVDLSPGPVSFAGHPALLQRDGKTERWRAVASGHTVVTVGRGKSRKTVYVFVPPVPSRQVENPAVDWYKTQFGTGIANCGPAVVAMAILWARGNDVSVEAVREEIGWPYDDGSTSFDDLQGSLRRHDVDYSAPMIATPAGLVSLLDKGHIAVVLIQSGQITKAAGDPSRNVVGRYYDDDEGHYVLVKGYSLDRRYFVVYDPYPVDWETNSLRYADGATMIGKDRYYSSADLFGALKTQSMIEISPGR